MNLLPVMELSHFFQDCLRVPGFDELQLSRLGEGCWRGRQPAAGFSNPLGPRGIFPGQV